MTIEKWIMLFVIGVGSVINLFFLRFAARKIRSAKASGTKIPWSFRIQVWLTVVAIGGMLGFWASVLRLYSSHFSQWANALLVMLTSNVALAASLFAILLVVVPTLFFSRRED